MLSNARRNLVRELHTRKGREKHGLCLVEGAKVIGAAGPLVEFTFTRAETDDFDRLVTTQTPQDIAGVARIPAWSLKDVMARDAVVVLDGVQDPGNAGTIARLCQAFAASLMLVDSADLTNPKAVRASAGAMFGVPWVRVPKDDAVGVIGTADRTILRVERRENAAQLVLDANGAASLPARAILILGAEGSGITLQVDGLSLSIPHASALESLNVSNAAAIVLYAHAHLRRQ